MEKASSTIQPQVSPVATLFVVSAIQFINPFLMSSISVALPTIGEELNASAVQLSLTLTVLILASTMLLLPMGRFADIYGRKKIFIIGTSIIALATIALGLVGSIQLFLIMRFIQGIGAAMILSTSLAILASVFPPQRRGRAMGLVVSMVYAGHALGPTIGGLIVEYLGWRWIFYFTFIWIVAALLLALFRFKGEWKDAEDEPFDYVGSIIFMAALFCIVTGASNISEYPMAKWIMVAGALLFCIFLRIEWKIQYPLLNLRLLVSNLEFSFSNIATFLNYASISSFIFMISLYLQYVKGFSPKQAGMIILIQPVIQALLAPIAGRLSEIFPPAKIATAGMALCTIGLAASSQCSFDTSLTYIISVLIILGISLGLFSTPNMIVIMSSVGPKDLGTASSMLATMRTIGILFSATTLAVILSIYLGKASINSENVGIFATSIHFSLIFFSALSLLGTVFSMVKGRLSQNVSPNISRT